MGVKNKNSPLFRKKGEGVERCGYIVPGTSDTIKNNLEKPVLTVWRPVIFQKCYQGGNHFMLCYDNFLTLIVEM